MNRTIKSGFILIALLTLTSTAIAQDDRDVYEYLFDTLTTGYVDPTPIGVDDMRYIGTNYISQADSTIMRYITAVIQYDIDFYADFELTLIDSFYLKTYEIKELDALGWSRLGADYLVKLEAEFPGRNIRVRWKIIDTARRQQFAKGSVEHEKEKWRLIGHEIGNEIVHTLTGEKGIFLSKIVYAKKTGTAKELFMADFDGANERQLTNNGSINVSPAFSPDGRQVYFTSYMEGDPKLFKVEVRSGKTSLVAAYDGIVTSPAISPDGKKIACVLSKDGNSEIYLLDTNGKVIKRLTNHRSIDSAPTWSPDGSMLAFQSDRSGAPQIYLMDSYGLNVRRLTYQGRYNDSPIWSSRGDRITFVSRTKGGRFDLASIDTSGTGFRVLTEVGMNENPHFAPDGKHLIFSSTRLGPMNIFTMDITGRNQRRLTNYVNCSNPN
ncbi:MAG: Tol-Pal system beta propeller repeat protein TolB, partial [bacterium]|nr:Tol-Pal system beta propeller repeat protein TolB [bacterium]